MMTIIKSIKCFGCFFPPTVCICVCVSVPVIWTDMLRCKLAIKFYCKEKKKSIWLHVIRDAKYMIAENRQAPLLLSSPHSQDSCWEMRNTHTHLCVLTLERLRLRGFWLLEPTLLDRRWRLNGLIHTEASLCCFWSGALVAVDGFKLYCCAHRCPYSCN